MRASCHQDVCLQLVADCHSAQPHVSCTQISEALKGTLPHRMYGKSRRHYGVGRDEQVIREEEITCSCNRCRSNSVALERLSLASAAARASLRALSPCGKSDIIRSEWSSSPVGEANGLSLRSGVLGLVPKSAVLDTCIVRLL